MKKNLYLLVTVLAIMIFACSEDTELEESVFIADPDFPSLPAYTEWGYNTFGAYIDREIFVYNDKVPAKVITSEGNTTFMLNGQKNYMNMSMKFELGDFTADTYTDLANLNDTIFDLTDPDCHVYIDYNGAFSELRILNGELEFKRAQLLLIDTQPAKVILSGYFNLQTLINEEPVSIYYGRFDVGIGEYINFYNY